MTGLGFRRTGRALVAAGGLRVSDVFVARRGWVRAVIAAVWAAALIPGGLYGLDFLEHLDLRIDAPAGSDSARADAELARAFPLQVDAADSILTLLLSIDVGDDASQPIVTTGGGSGPIAWLNCTAIEPCATLVPAAQRFSTLFHAWADDACGADWVRPATYRGYAYYQSLGFWLLQNRTLSDAANPSRSRASIITLQPPSHLAKRLASELPRVIDRLVDQAVAEAGAPPTGRLRVQAAGMQLFNAALLQSVTQQTRLIDTVSLPLAVLVFAYMLRNVRLLIIPLVNVLLVIAVAFAAMDGLANNVLQVASTTPPFMLSVVIAMSIDYSLFLLTRFHEELTKARVKLASDTHGGGEERGRAGEGGGVGGAAWQHDSDAMGAIVNATINGAGRTVLVSGTIMFACVVGLTPLPTELLASMGAGAALVVGLSVLVNLTLTPLFLLTFPRFFSNFANGGLGCLCGPCTFVSRALRRRRHRRADGRAKPLLLDVNDQEATCSTHGSDGGDSDGCGGSSGLKSSSDSSGASSSASATARAACVKPAPSEGAACHVEEGLPAAPRRRRTCAYSSEGAWRHVALVATGRVGRWVVPMLVLALALPCISRLPTFKKTTRLEMMVPTDSPPSIAARAIVADFGAVSLPYSLLLSPRHGAGVRSAAFFDDVNEIIRGLAARNGSYSSACAPDCPIIRYEWLHSVTGVYIDPTGANGTRGAGLTAERMEPQADGEWLPLPPGFWEVSRRAHATQLQVIWDQLVSADNATLAVMITLPFDCASQDGDLWLYAARDALASVLESGEEAEQRDPLIGGGGGDDVGSRVSASLAGGTGEMLDAKTAVYSTLPLLVGIVFTIVFVILAVAFRSLLVPIRAVLSIALTMGWVFGFATSVYQDGLLAWTGLSCFAVSPDGISWLLPIISFACMAGLGLDYDIFLLSRIHELRLSGLSDLDAIREGLVTSAGVISAAGLIMTFAFSGLFLTNTVSINQLGLVLVSSVLLDTFVVRTLILPALMAILGPYNWWPSRPPAPNAATAPLFAPQAPQRAPPPPAADEPQ